MTIGEKIRNARKTAKMTQKALGSSLGVSPQMIAQYEAGKRQPKIEQLQKIAAALNIHISVFLEEMSESEKIKSTWEWIKDKDTKREELLIEILKTHNYKIENKDIHGLTITDSQGFRYYVNQSDFQDMALRCDKDICYNMEKLLSSSREIPTL